MGVQTTSDTENLLSPPHAFFCILNTNTLKMLQLTNQNGSMKSYIRQVLVGCFHGGFLGVCFFFPPGKATE